MRQIRIVGKNAKGGTIVEVAVKGEDGGYWARRFASEIATEEQPAGGTVLMTEEEVAE